MRDAEIQALLSAAVKAQRGGDSGKALRLFQEVIDSGWEDALAINAVGIHALRDRRLVDAAALFKRAIAVDPHSPDLWMNLAKALREQGDQSGERLALDGALSLDPRHFMALVRYAELLERVGDEDGAAKHWSGVLATAAAIEDRAPELEIMLEHARDKVAQHRAAFAAKIDAGLGKSIDALGGNRRIVACIDHALGRRPIYVNHCAGMHFPFLPADEFFDRDHFPWLNDLEAKTEEIKSELMALLAEPDAGFLPYVSMQPGAPENKWTALNNTLDWGAFHVWKNGQRIDAACARLPKTSAIIDRLPLCDLPERTPTVFFSLLKAGTHLPAHTGVSNVRTIIHLPLIIPKACSFRVGGETRDWEEGRAWAFDDTIEHEAWNRSAEDRIVLILDVWNPYISENERTVLRQFYSLTATGESVRNPDIDIAD